jgi:hypothetical protein
MHESWNINHDMPDLQYFSKMKHNQDLELPKTNDFSCNKSYDAT